MVTILIAILIIYVSLVSWQMIFTFVHEFGHYIVSKYICDFKDTTLHLNFKYIFIDNFIDSFKKKRKFNCFGWIESYDSTHEDFIKLPLYKEFLLSFSGPIASILFSIFLLIGLYYPGIPYNFYWILQNGTSLGWDIFLIVLMSYIIFMNIAGEFIGNLNIQGSPHNDINQFISLGVARRKLYSRRGWKLHLFDGILSQLAKYWNSKIESNPVNQFSPYTQFKLSEFKKRQLKKKATIHSRNSI